MPQCFKKEIVLWIYVWICSELLCSAFQMLLRTSTNIFLTIYILCVIYISIIHTKLSLEALTAASDSDALQMYHIIKMARNRCRSSYIYMEGQSALIINMSLVNDTISFHFDILVYFRNLKWTCALPSASMLLLLWLFIQLRAVRNDLCFKSWHLMTVWCLVR